MVLIAAFHPRRQETSIKFGDFFTCSLSGKQSR
jgi:hypothetical protein